MGALLESAVDARSVDVAVVRGVRIGRLHLDGVRSAGLLPDVIDRREDGLLPLAALGPVLLDLSNRLVIAWARPRAQRATVPSVRSSQSSDSLIMSAIGMLWPLS